MWRFLIKGLGSPGCVMVLVPDMFPVGKRTSEEAAVQPIPFENVGDVVATRELTLDGNRKVEVRIGKPERLPDSDDLVLPPTIIGIGSGRVKQMSSVDSVQALVLTLAIVGIELYCSEEYEAGRLACDWGAAKGDLGFPLPKSVRDVLPPDSSL